MHILISSDNLFPYLNTIFCNYIFFPFYFLHFHRFDAFFISCTFKLSLTYDDDDEDADDDDEEKTFFFGLNNFGE